MVAVRQIELEGVRVHNLKGVDVTIRHGVLTVICGVSGSGKSSLAFDTLHAEGQRRYIETFSPGARQFLDRIERPDADRIDGIPPSIAMRQNSHRHNSRSTVGTRTEILNYLRLLYVRAGRLICPGCSAPITRFSPESAARLLLQRQAGQKVMLGFQLDHESADLTLGEPVQHQLLQRGFVRVLQDQKIVRLDKLESDALTQFPVTVVLDRMSLQTADSSRLLESLETALNAGDGECFVWCECSAAASASEQGSTDAEGTPTVVMIDGREWQQYRFSSRLRCTVCRRNIAEPSTDLLNFNSVIGACRVCEGTGAVSALRMEKCVPDQQLSLRQGAIQPWNPPAWQHELQELLALAPDYDLPTDIPFARLTAAHLQLIAAGVPERGFGGLDGFHRWLVTHRYRQGVRVFLNRWRSWICCPECRGSRLTPEASAIRLRERSLPELSEMELESLLEWLVETLSCLPQELQAGLVTVTNNLLMRLRFLLDSGLGYLTLNRSLRTLSGGEAQRVLLTTALGTGLINTLYVLDEPTSGLHQQDTQRIIRAVRMLKNAGNSIVVVEHDPEFLMAADELIEIGPGAGETGGQVVFQGHPQKLIESGTTITAEKLRQHLSDGYSAQGSVAEHEARQAENMKSASSAETAAGGTGELLPAISHWLTLTDVRCHNIYQLDVRLPLGVIAAVSGVSGSGKSSLVVESLYPALCRLKGQECGVEGMGTIQSISGAESIDRVMMLDQRPLQKTRRSIPATWIGIFDDIRRLLADTHEARRRNYTAAAFSFNSARGGRCPNCEGLGCITIEMQFLADIRTTCEVCGGRRFRPDVLEVRFRNRSVHEILEMTADTAFPFFSGHPRIQQRLNAIRQAGLGYVRLGQPLSTLSGGEAQRLRIAGLLAGVPLEESGDIVGTAARDRRPRGAGDATLFLLDEPSTGLHLSDLERLLQCFRYLVQLGHSVLIIDHDDYLLSRVDYRVEMGPGAGRHGGRVVTSGCSRTFQPL